MLLGRVIVGHFELLDFMLYFEPVDVDLILHAIELIVPTTGYVLFLNH